jgi:hypothetical protein|tara:strand:+ start:532 stop:768 length:237 start_codon:yes stop_codon:yes gene_type:complete
MNPEEQIKVLKKTIQWFKKQIEPRGCGWMYTTIDGLKHRIKILKNEMKRDLPKETWIEGYNKHKKNYDQWKNERCPHN